VITFTYPAFLPWLLPPAAALLALGLTRLHLPTMRPPSFILHPTPFILLYTATFATQLTLRLRAFGTTAFDLGIFDQATWLLSRGLVPFVTLRGLNAFGDHTSFILLLVAPLYWLFDSPVTLFVLASLVVGLGALPLYALAREQLGGRWSPLVVALAYLLYPAVEYVSMANFHPESLAMPLALAALLFGFRGQRLRFGLCAGLAALCKEDVALTIFALGLYLAWRGRRRLGLITAGLALAWLALCLLVLLPAFNPAGAVYLSLYAGGPPGSWTPLATLQRLLEPQRLEYLPLLLLPLGLLPLLGPGGLLIALPALLVNLLSARENTATIFYHYSAMVAPWFLVGTIEALRRCPARLQAAASLYLLLSSLAAHLLFAPSPLSLGFLRNASTVREPFDGVAALPRVFREQPRDELGRAALALIPPNAAVAATSVYAVHLAHRQQVYQLPLPFENGLHDDGLTPFWGTSERELPSATVDYVLIDPSESIWPARRTQIANITSRLRRDPSFEVIFNQDGLLVFQHRPPP
jgi:uncharacterized membrane protein